MAVAGAIGQGHDVGAPPTSVTDIRAGNGRIGMEVRASCPYFPPRQVVARSGEWYDRGLCDVGESILG
ncbi:hypothetical protein MRX96_017674 [Rhipicephalus microplus]